MVQEEAEVGQQLEELLEPLKLVVESVQRYRKVDVVGDDHIDGAFVGSDLGGGYCNACYFGSVILVVVDLHSALAGQDIGCCIVSVCFVVVGCFVGIHVDDLGFGLDSVDSSGFVCCNAVSAVVHRSFVLASCCLLGSFGVGLCFVFVDCFGIDSFFVGCCIGLVVVRSSVVQDTAGIGRIVGFELVIELGIVVVEPCKPYIVVVEWPIVGNIADRRLGTLGIWLRVFHQLG